nr:MAG TPA: hypothetical protein [Caudoviricetes sp.]
MVILLLLLHHLFYILFHLIICMDLLHYILLL